LNNHLAHAVLFDEELDRLHSQSPERYAAVAERIRPLLTIQMTEMAKKLVRNRRALHNLRQAAQGADEGRESREG
jgi:hypothetical protein